MSKRKRSQAPRSLLGDNLRRLQPKLRMVANGDAAVNTIRAEVSAAIKVNNARLLSSIPQVRGANAEPLSRQAFRKAFRKKPAKPTYLKKLARDVRANVFIHTTTPEALP